MKKVGGMDISVVAPLYNEEETVELLYASILSAVSGLDIPFQIVFVDDGSTDRTFAVARELARTDSRLRVVKFRRNFGQTAAMAAGIEHSNGGIIITMDGDMQNDPSDIPLFIDKMREGYDIVAGWRFQRKDKLISRKIPSMIANKLIGWVTGVPIKDNGCSLKAYRSEVIKNIRLYSEMHRFIPAMMSIAGSKIAEIKVSHHERRFGVSKYGISRTYKVLLDLLVVKTIVSFTARPLLWFALLAVPPFLFGSVCLLLGVHLSLVEQTTPFPLSGAGLLFVALSGFLVLGGVLGELIHKTGDISTSDLSSLTTSIYESPIRNKE